MFQRGGVFGGLSHAEGGTPIVVKPFDKPVEVEKDEYLICTKALEDTQIHDYYGTTLEILDQIFQRAQCIVKDNEAWYTDYVVCKRAVLDPNKYHYKGTIKEVFNMMQSKHGCKIEPIDVSKQPKSNDMKMTDVTKMEVGGKINKDFDLGKDHSPFIEVVWPGSSCGNCKFLYKKDGKPHCGSELFTKWNKTSKLPDNVHSLCSDWYEPNPKLLRITNFFKLREGGSLDVSKLSDLSIEEVSYIEGLLNDENSVRYFSSKEIFSLKEKVLEHPRYSLGGSLASVNTSEVEFFTDEQGRKRFKINDVSAKLNELFVKELIEDVNKSKESSSLKLKEIIYYWEGYKYYPDLKNLQVDFEYNENKNYLAAYHHKNDSITINVFKLEKDYERYLIYHTGTSKKVQDDTRKESGTGQNIQRSKSDYLLQLSRRKLFHELVHAIQKREGIDLPPTQQIDVFRYAKAKYGKTYMTDDSFSKWLSDKYNTPNFISALYQEYKLIPSEKEAFDAEVEIKKHFDAIPKLSSGGVLGKSTIHERPDMENPVYVVNVNGVDKFIQRQEGMNPSDTSWYEVAKEPKHGIWKTVGKQDVPYFNNIGYTRKEAIETLFRKYAIMEDGGNLENSGKLSTFNSNTTKDEIKNVLSGINQVINGSYIQATANHLRRNEGASPMATNRKYVKEQEESLLRQYARIIPISNFKNYIGEGAENKVYRYDDHWVLKINGGYFYNSWLDYFNNLLLHNYFFPQTSYELVGFTEENERLFPVVKQPYIRATKEVDLLLVKKILSDNGFRNNKNNDYINEKLGIILEDLHDQNVIIRDSILYFIDTVFFLSPSFNANNPKPKMEDGGSFKRVKPDPNSPEILERWKKKKEHIEQIASSIRGLRGKITRDLKSEDEKVRLTALVVAIMDNTAERVGNACSASNGHFGVTCFLKKHICFLDNMIRFTYTGKSGVEHAKQFSDPLIASVLREAIKDSPSKFVFTTSDGFQIHADRVNRYLSEYGISAKDIRGYHANSYVIKRLGKEAIPDSEKKRKTIFNKAVKYAAGKVGHGAGTLKNHYLMPEVGEQYVVHGKIIDLCNFFDQGKCEVEIKQAVALADAGGAQGSVSVDVDNQSNNHEEPILGATGALIIARDTGRVLLLLRSPSESETATWCTVGGKIDDGETILEALYREMMEEIRFNRVEVHASYINRSKGFPFYNYLGYVDSEFIPVLNEEHTDYGWFSLSDLPVPLHFGVDLLLQHADVSFYIQEYTNAGKKVNKKPDISPVINSLFNDHSNSYSFCLDCIDKLKSVEDHMVYNLSGKILELWEEDMIEHFKEEEEQLFPYISGVNNYVDSKLSQFLMEHKEFGNLVVAIRGNRHNKQLIAKFVDALMWHIQEEEKVFSSFVKDYNFEKSNAKHLV